MECARHDIACRLEAIENAADSVLNLLHKIEGAMDAAQGAAEATGDYLSAEYASPSSASRFTSSSSR